MGISHVTIVDDKSVLHPTTQVQDSMAFTAARGEPSISTKDRVDVCLAEHALLEMLISSMAVLHQSHQSVAAHVTPGKICIRVSV